MEGISARHGPHQVAHRFKKTVLPRYLLKSTTSPSGVVTAKEYSNMPLRGSSESGFAFIMPVASTTLPAADCSPLRAFVFCSSRNPAPANTQGRAARHTFLRTPGITDVLIGSILNNFESPKMLISTFQTL